MTVNKKKTKKSTALPEESVDSRKEIDKNQPVMSALAGQSVAAKLPKLGTTVSAKEWVNLTNSISDYDSPFFKSLEKLNNLNEHFVRSFPTYQSNYLSIDKIRVDEEIIDLKKRLKEAVDSKQDVQNVLEELQQKEINAHVIRRIHPAAVDRYLSNQAFRDQFEHRRETNAIVVSIDIRRSTELMLKARKADLYSDFITELSNKLSHVIIGNYGIFDKFTGDGILAFFPEFYSGKDSVLFALKAAQECHEVFKEHYKSSKDKFSVFIQDVGLGIGIDYGLVTLVNTGAELTVVGRPVVYACRFGGAKAGETLMNMEAYEILETKRPTPLVRDVIESEIYIKNEGNALAYQPIINLVPKIQLHFPDWLEPDN